MGYYSSYQFNNVLYCDQSDETCVVSDLNKRTICYDLKIVQCGGTINNPCSLAVTNGGLLICDPTQSWNCNLCANDLPYYNIVADKDVLYFQFQQLDDNNGFGWGYVSDANVFAGGIIRDCCTGNPIQKSVGVNLEVVDVIGSVDFIGVYGTTNYQGITTYSNLQQITIDMDLLKPYLISNNTDCFYIEFQFNLHVTPYSIFTEPFKLEHCDDTLFIESFYTSKDCYGQYYGNDTSPLWSSSNWGQFNYNYRLKGYLELESISIEKEFVGNRDRTVSSQTIEKYMLKTHRLPEQVVRMLSNMLSAPVIKIDGVEYVVDGDMSKNNEVGNQWFLEVGLRRIGCSETFGNCNS